MKLSVLIPTLLRADPRRYREGRLWLEAAIESVRAQILLPDNQAELEIVVAMDAMAGDLSPRHRATIEANGPIIWTRGTASGNPATVNAAALAAHGEVFAFLDDDDLWHPAWLSTAVPLLRAYDMVSASAALIDLTGKFLGHFDFPLPSSWVMHRALWERMNGLDLNYCSHPDTEFLGRVNAAKCRRVHVLDGASRNRRSEWLDEISRNSDLLITRNPPLVIHSQTPGGLTDMTQTDEAVRAQSREEYDLMIARFGAVPW